MRKHPSEHSEAECNEASSIFNCQGTRMRQYTYICIYPFMEIYIYADISRNLDLGNPQMKTSGSRDFYKNENSHTYLPDPSGINMEILGFISPCVDLRVYFCMCSSLDVSLYTSLYVSVHASTYMPVYAPVHASFYPSKNRKKKERKKRSKRKK